MEEVMIKYEITFNFTEGLVISDFIVSEGSEESIRNRYI